METSQILGYVSTFIFSVMYIPQIYTTIKSDSIKDVSLVMFLMGLIGNIVALLYAFLIGQTPLQIKYTIALVFIGLYLAVYFKVKHGGKKVILVSNNVQGAIALPTMAVIRINMAWVSDIKQLKNIIESNSMRHIFLDYPRGRSKPPRPILSIEDAYNLINLYNNIKYFAVSNIETIDSVKEIQNNIPTEVEFVPKIETEDGVYNLSKLIDECKIKTIMLDKEDLFVDVEQDNTEFYKCVAMAKRICLEKKVKLLELQGVIFIGDDVK